jgi:hypothetical protein
MFTNADTPPSTSNLHEPAELVRWTFLRQGRMLTCEILVNGPSSYDVCVIPHWDAGSSLIEEFEFSPVALWRHADLVSHFRETGWVRISETDADTLSAA